MCWPPTSTCRRTTPSYPSPSEPSSDSSTRRAWTKVISTHFSTPTLHMYICTYVGLLQGCIDIHTEGKAQLTSCSRCLGGCLNVLTSLHSVFVYILVCISSACMYIHVCVYTYIIMYVWASVYVCVCVCSMVSSRQAGCMGRVGASREGSQPSTPLPLPAWETRHQRQQYRYAHRHT